MSRGVQTNICQLELPQRMNWPQPTLGPIDTIKQVLGAVPSIGTSYGIIVNQIPPNTYNQSAVFLYELQ